MSRDDEEKAKSAFSEILSGMSLNERLSMKYQFDITIRAAVTDERYSAFLNILRATTRASWWIDNRGTALAQIIQAMHTEIDAAVEASKPVAEETATLIRDAQAEALLKPAYEAKSTQIAEISLVGKQLRVAFPEKNETFRLLMRGMGFSWTDPVWAKTMDVTTGNPVDRMAETAHRIIGAGFMARLYDDDARAKAISGQFEPEQTRWITKAAAGSYAGWCMITWPKSDDLYAPAKRLLGARYKDGRIYVPPGSILSWNAGAARRRLPDELKPAHAEIRSTKYLIL